jgi:hypothetical protein
MGEGGLGVQSGLTNGGNVVLNWLSEPLLGRATGMGTHPVLWNRAVVACVGLPWVASSASVSM